MNILINITYIFCILIVGSGLALLIYDIICEEINETAFIKAHKSLMARGDDDDSLHKQ